MATPDIQLEQRVAEFVELCRRQGMRATHQRVEVFREVAGTEEHPDAETVYQGVRMRIPSISRDTVYRTLATLEEKGLIRRAEILGGPTRFDANTDVHHHFICAECGTIKDFHSKRLEEIPIPRSVRQLGHVEYAQVQIRGVCSDCMKKNRRR